MIGKKSKFEEHERKSRSSISDQKDLKTSKSTTSGKGRTEKSDSINTNEINNVTIRNKNCEIGDVIELYEDLGRQITEEEIEEIPEEVQQLAGACDTPRSKSSDSENSSGKSSTDTGKIEQKTSKVTILTPENIKTDTELLWDEICNGVKGKNSGIPMGFNRLNKYLGLRKSIYTTIGAAAGCGKTSLVDCAYVLNPYDWYIKNKDKATTNVKFEAIYFSMERKKTYKLAKWLCLKIWKEEHILITTDELLSWQNTLDKKKQEVAKFYIDNYFKEMTESGVITIIDGQQNPTGIYKFMKAHALKRGKVEEISEFENRYIPNDDNLITNVIHDHAGKTKNENIGGKYDKKLSIDKASEYYCWARDYLGYSPIMINQFNRTSYQDIQFSKKEGGDPDPTVEYWKDSGNVIEDCDVAISLFNPYKYSLEEYMGYKINDFTDGQGNNKFRGLKIIKNSYGTDNLRIGLGFLGEVSLFKELTKSTNITGREINSLINNDFFLDF
jgi:hypothetical protein